MLAAIRKEAGRGLFFLQFRPTFRAAGRKLAGGITVTEASPADLATVRSRLNPGDTPQPSPPDPAVTNLFAVRRGKITGFIQRVRHPPSHAPYVGYWLFSLQVLHPLDRGTGTGEMLTRAVLDIARANGAPMVYLVVRETNLPAVSHYKKPGFRQVIVPGLEEQLKEEAVRQENRRITRVKRFHE